MMRRGAAFLAVLLLAACAAPPPPLGTEIVPAKLENSVDRFTLTVSDGIELPGRIWRAEDPALVAIALHGFNDYSAAFDTVGPALAAEGITVYAYDQRGYGEAPGRTAWPGATRMLEDLMDMATTVRARHPGLPLALIGESMGGALALDGAARPNVTAADRVVLIAPAVWGRSSMRDWAWDILDWAHRHIPGYHLTFQSYIRPSDNPETLRRLADDPLVIKGARIDAVHGLVGLMETGYREAARLEVPALILYGARDVIVPRKPTCRMLAKLPSGHRTRVAAYPDGHHLLTRDTNGTRVIADIAAFLKAPAAPLPSGAEAANAWPDAICGPRPRAGNPE
ncbi:MAG: lysophospholipase [Alphaproteobacteria bacterium]|nr:lysophospholipase [Alphaproteobacteria bacterium]